MAFTLKDNGTAHSVGSIRTRSRRRWKGGALFGLTAAGLDGSEEIANGH
jgi:hypothetical protein